VIAAGWFFVIYRLNRQYARAFEQALSSRWLDAEGAAESMRVPGARRALEAALRSPEEPRALLALDLARYIHHPRIAKAVLDDLDRPSPAVRASTIRAMESLRLRDDRNRVREMLADTNDRVCSAAVSYELAMSARQVEYARSLRLTGDAQQAVSVLEERLQRFPDDQRSTVQAELRRARRDLNGG